MQSCIERHKENPESSKMFEEQYMGPEYDLEEMIQLPQGFFRIHICLYNQDHGV